MKQKIIAGLIIVLILGLGGYKLYTIKNPSPETAVVATTTNSEGEVITTEKTVTNSSVNVTTSVPINGVYKGVIEVGASGFNSFVINMDKDKNWELVSKEFGKSLAYEGFITVDDVQKGLKDYISSISTKGVAGRNIHFVMSSGALKNEKTKLIASAIEKMGYVVNRVTPEQEGKYALSALLPKAYVNNSFVVDIGSGNTKISWYENGKSKSLECSGAKYYQDGKTDAVVAAEVAAAISKIPQSNITNCFIIGGVPYQLAKQVRNGEERFTLLKNADFYSAGDDVKLRSGLNIYRAIENASKCETYIFDWDANFTVGFLLTLN